MNPELLEEVAVLVDKYFFHKVMYYACDNWLRRFSKYARSSHYTNAAHHNLLAVAHLLGNAEMFTQISRELILHWQGPFKKLGTMQHTLPWPVLLDLETKRTKKLGKMIRTIHGWAMSEWLVGTDLSNDCSRGPEHRHGYDNSCCVNVSRRFVLNDRNIKTGDERPSLVGL